MTVPALRFRAVSRPSVLDSRGVDLLLDNRGVAVRNIRSLAAKPEETTDSLLHLDCAIASLSFVEFRFLLLSGGKRSGRTDERRYLPHTFSGCQVVFLDPPGPLRCVAQNPRIPAT